ncbi:MAG: TetR/AcrR family transcriptional regulator [Pseudomonadota bacterium]
MQALQRKSSRDSILDAATYVLAHNPGASLGEIALKAGVGRATLHRHFAKREDLIRDLALRSIEEVNAAVADTVDMDADPPTALRQLFAATVPLGDKYQFLCSEMSGYDAEVSAVYETQLVWLVPVVERLQADGHLGQHVSTDWAITMIDAIIWAAWSAVHDGSIARRDAAQLAYETFMNGLGARPAAPD